MRALLVLLCLLAASPSWAASYYISPTGVDTNNGTSTSTPWASPNHTGLVCGDTITAAAGAYSGTNGNFSEGHWGTVSCPGNNNVVWLQCATFDACTINATTDFAAIWVDKSYWGVSGWDVTESGTTNETSCFQFTPNTSTLVSVHHVIFANNVAHTCYGAGFGAYNQSATASVDYVTYIGNIVYNAALGSTACGSGLDIYEPIAYDTAGGTHIYVANNFSWHNFNSNPCASTAPTDGEGINIDTLDGDQQGVTPYLQQVAVENNLVFYNGGRGVEVEYNSTGTTQAYVYVNHNTAYNDLIDTNQGYCLGNGDFQLYLAYNVTATYNLAQTGSSAGCMSDPVYAFSVSTINSSVSVDYNYLSGTSGNNTFLYNSTGFSYGSHNVIGTNPTFSNPVDPGAPSCSGKTNTINCMATVIADYTATVTAAKAYGFQSPTGGSVIDPYYPSWLCNVTLPTGLINPGCSLAPSLTKLGNVSSHGVSR